ncbi:MAG: hypothetical protein ACKV0T_02575 [Planctomycetales bacterium]
MNFPEFLAALFEHGVVRAPPFGLLAPEELQAGRERLVTLEEEYRSTLPGDPPEFVPLIAEKAAVTMFRLCQCLVYRDLEVEPTLAANTQRLIPPASPASTYSTDLTLRFLPDVWRLSRDVSREDPLVKLVVQLATQSPLSSVGIAGVEGVVIDGFAADNCLMTLYVDRILERRDRSRLTDPRVRLKVQEVLGMFTELSPELALASQTPQPTD